MQSRVLFFLFLVSASGQQLEYFNQQVSGKAARDSRSNWVFAENVANHVRVRKLSPDFSQTYFDFTIGGSGNESVVALKLDTAGNACVLGTTTSNDFPTTPGALWPTDDPAADRSFFLKVDGAGKIVTSTYLQSPGVGIVAADFVAASNGDWIIAAQTHGGNSAISSGGVEISGPPGTALLLRIDADATVLRGGRWADFGPLPGLAGLKTDPGGNLYLAGSTSADNFPVTPGAFLGKRLSGTCFSGIGFGAVPIPCPTGFVIKLDGTDLHTLAATYLGGNVTANIRALALDQQGYPYVTGIIARTSPSPADFPVTPGAFQTQYPGSLSTEFLIDSTIGVPFVTKLLPDLSGLVYSTFLAGSNGDGVSAIAVDDAGRALVSGVTLSADFPVTGAFQIPCGPFGNSNTGFVTRVAADGSAVSSSAILDAEATVAFVDGSDTVVVTNAANDLVRVHLAPASGPVAACTFNAANFERQPFLAPSQLVTVMGAAIPNNAVLLFNGMLAPLLYVGPTQMNAVVPKEVAGSTAVTMEIEVDGTRSNARQFAVLDPNPTVKIYIAPDGSLDNRGNLLADVTFSDGSQNTENQPAHVGDIVAIYTTGLDLSLPITVQLNNVTTPVLEVSEYPGSFGGAIGLEVQIPDAGRGVVLVHIQNGSASTGQNPGFVWVQ